MIAFVGRGGQANLHAGYGFCVRGGSHTIAAAGHGDGKLDGRRRRDGALVAAYIAGRIPVSYTHLDVYKRQGKTYAGKTYVGKSNAIK